MKTHQIYFFAQKWLAEAVLETIQSAPGYFSKGWTLRKVTNEQIKAEALLVYGAISDAKAKDAPYFLLEMKEPDPQESFFSGPDFFRGAAQGAKVAILRSKKIP